MLSVRQKIAMTMSVVAASAGVAAMAQSPATSSPAPGHALHRATVPISIVPGVIGPGKSLQSSASARWAVTAKYPTAKAGKKAVLQRLSGTTWVVADKTEIGQDGTALFAVPGSVSGGPVSYRVDGPGFPTEAVSTDRWGTEVDFVDEFSGSKLGPAWEQRQQFYQPESKRLCSKGDSKAVKVGSGTAQLSVLIDKKRNSLCKPKKPGKQVIFGKFKYRLNANIGTQQTHSITYGVTAARIKFHPEQGQHASLWMQPKYPNGATNPAQAGAEVDIIEWFGKDVPNGGLTSFIYAPKPGGGAQQYGSWIHNPDQYLQDEKDSWYKKYHVFSVEWTPSAYIFRIDGVETRRITQGISGVPEYPILSLLSSDYELSKLPDEKTDLPQTMNIDWIHTWQDPAHLPPAPTTP